MNRYQQERDYLLYEAGSSPYSGQRPSLGRIVPSDYVAAAKNPVNLLGPIAGSCLIWRGALDAAGYGVLRINDRQEQAHRAPYRQTRGVIPEAANVLHMCNRRSCVQPAHLYTGAHAENSRDRKVRFGDHQADGLPLVIQAMTHWRDRGYPIPAVDYDPVILGEVPMANARRAMDEVSDWHERAWEAAAYTWPDPPAQPVMSGMKRPEPPHRCRFTIPAGSTQMCEICFNSESGMSRTPGGRE